MLYIINTSVLLLILLLGIFIILVLYLAYDPLKAYLFELL